MMKELPLRTKSALDERLRGAGAIEAATRRRRRAGLRSSRSTPRSHEPSWPRDEQLGLGQRPGRMPWSATVVRTPPDGAASDREPTVTRIATATVQRAGRGSCDGCCQAIRRARQLVGTRRSDPQIDRNARGPPSTSAGRMSRAWLCEQRDSALPGRDAAAASRSSTAGTGRPSTTT